MENWKTYHDSFQQKMLCRQSVNKSFRADLNALSVHFVDEKEKRMWIKVVSNGTLETNCWKTKQILTIWKHETCFRLDNTLVEKQWIWVKVLKCCCKLSVCMQKCCPLKKPKFCCVSTWHFMLSWNVCVFQSFSEGGVGQPILSFLYPLLSACSKLLSKWQIHQATLRLCHKCANAVGVARTRFQNQKGIQCFVPNFWEHHGVLTPLAAF